MNHTSRPGPSHHAISETIERRLLMSVSTSGMPVLAGGDFDGNGTSETLVWVNAGRGRLADLGYFGSAFRRGSIVLLDGNGSLLGDPLGIRARGATAPLVAAGDFNADGRLDLVLAGRRLSGARRGLTFLPGGGDGTFGAGVSIGGAPSNVTSLVAADANGDGRLDLIGTAAVPGGRNTGAGSNGNVVVVRRPASGDSDDDGRRVVDTGPTDFGATRPHLVGAGAEAGGGVSNESPVVNDLPGGNELLFFAGGEFTGRRDFASGPDAASRAPGFTPFASQVGASAETGGARVGGFGNSGEFFFDGDPIDDTNAVFVLLGDGDGTFTLSTGSDAG